MLYDGSWIVGFSGIDRLRNNVVRIMYRTYLAPEIRATGLNISRQNWKMSGQAQLEFCKRMKYHPVISRENNGRINAARNICNEANRTTGFKWRVLNGYYHTCSHTALMNQACWQKIIAYEKLQVLDLPHITSEQYENMFL